MAEREASRYVSFAPPHVHSPDHPTHNEAGRHAWVVVGDETIFLCHLMMGWMQGHNYEAVLEVSLPSEAIDEIREDRRINGTTHFLGNQHDPAGGHHAKGERDRAESESTAFRPAHSIPHLASGQITGFRADIWNYFPAGQCSQEWPYPPRTEFLRDVDVKVERVVHYRHINPNISGQRHESYLLFGRGAEAHLYHNVVDQPDYDQVASLVRSPGWVQPEQLQAGVIVSVPSLPWSAGTTRCFNPLPNHTRMPVLYHGIRRYRDPLVQDATRMIPVPKLEIEVDRTWWFSTRVVNWPPEDPCGKGFGDIPTPFWPDVDEGDCV